MSDTKEDDVLLDIIDFVDPSITPDEYNAIRAMYNSIYDKNIDSTNIVSNIILLMKIASTFPNVANIDKKKLVLFVIQKFIQLNVLNKDDATILNSFIQNILPNVIDSLYSIDTKKIIIEGEQKIKNCCLPFF